MHSGVVSLPPSGTSLLATPAPGRGATQSHLMQGGTAPARSEPSCTRRRPRCRPQPAHSSCCARTSYPSSPALRRPSSTWPAGQGRGSGEWVHGQLAGGWHAPRCLRSAQHCPAAELLPLPTPQPMPSRPTPHPQEEQRLKRLQRLLPRQPAAGAVLQLECHAGPIRQAQGRGLAMRVTGERRRGVAQRVAAGGAADVAAPRRRAQGAQLAAAAGQGDCGAQGRGSTWAGGGWRGGFRGQRGTCAAVRIAHPHGEPTCVSQLLQVRKHLQQHVGWQVQQGQHHVHGGGSLGERAAVAAGVEARC